MCDVNGPVRDALRDAGITYDADAETDADGKKTGHGKSEEEAPTPMFLALNDAVARRQRALAPRPKGRRGGPRGRRRTGTPTRSEQTRGRWSPPTICEADRNKR